MERLQVELVKLVDPTMVTCRGTESLQLLILEWNDLDRVSI